MADRYEVMPFTLYSLLRERLLACRQHRARPHQWIGIIRNLQSSGVSATEIDHSDLMYYLQRCEPGSRVGLDELIAVVDRIDHCTLRLQRRVSDDYKPSIRFERLQSSLQPPEEVVRAGRREVRELCYRDRTFGFCLWHHTELENSLFEPLTYWSFSVPSGTRLLPDFENGKRFETLGGAMGYGRRLAARMAGHLDGQGFVGPAKAKNAFSRYSLPFGDEYSEWLITAPNLPVSYVGPHFQIRNLVAHVRTTERVSENGERLLMLEEIQSDWNQELQKVIKKRKRLALINKHLGENAVDPEKGVPGPPMNPYLNHWLDAALRMMLVLAVRRGCTGIAWAPGHVHASRFPAENDEGLKDFYDRIVLKAVERLIGPWGGSVGETQIETLYERYEVCARSIGEWQIVDLVTEVPVGEPFHSRTAAENARQKMETHTLLTVPCALIPEGMWKSVRALGLPQLGAIGLECMKRPEVLAAVRFRRNMALSA